MRPPRVRGGSPLGDSAGPKRGLAFTVSWAPPTVGALGATHGPCHLEGGLALTAGAAPGLPPPPNRRQRPVEPSMPREVSTRFCLSRLRARPVLYGEKLRPRDAKACAQAPQLAGGGLRF